MLMSGSGVFFWTGVKRGSLEAAPGNSESSATATAHDREQPHGSAREESIRGRFGNRRGDTAVQDQVIEIERGVCGGFALQIKTELRGFPGSQGGRAQ